MRDNRRHMPGMNKIIRKVSIVHHTEIFHEARNFTARQLVTLGCLVPLVLLEAAIFQHLEYEHANNENAQLLKRGQDFENNL